MSTCCSSLHTSCSTFCCRRIALLRPARRFVEMRCSVASCFARDVCSLLATVDALSSRLPTSRTCLAAAFVCSFSCNFESLFFGCFSCLFVLVLCENRPEKSAPHPTQYQHAWQLQTIVPGLLVVMQLCRAALATLNCCLFFVFLLVFRSFVPRKLCKQMADAA